jgi:hypothetical protein
MNAHLEPAELVGEIGPFGSTASRVACGRMNRLPPVTSISTIFVMLTSPIRHFIIACPLVCESPQIGEIIGPAGPRVTVVGKFYTRTIDGRVGGVECVLIFSGLD